MSALGAATKINSGKRHAREGLQGGARRSGHAGPDQGYSSEGADTRHSDQTASRNDSHRSRLCPPHSRNASNSSLLKLYYWICTMTCIRMDVIIYSKSRLIIYNDFSIITYFLACSCVLTKLFLKERWSYTFLTPHLYLSGRRGHLL